MRIQLLSWWRGRRMARKAPPWMADFYRTKPIARKLKQEDLWRAIKALEDREGTMTR